VVVGIAVIVVISSFALLLLNQQNDTSVSRYAADPDSAVHILANGDIYLKEIDSSTLPIARNGSTYNLVNNCIREFIIEKSNIVLDGNGYSIDFANGGSNYQKIDLSSVTNVTIKNVVVEPYYTSIRFNHTSNSTVQNCTAEYILFLNSQNNLVTNTLGSQFTFQESSNNTVANCTADSFEFEKSNNNLVFSNSNSTVFVGTDLSFGDSSNNLFFGNTFGKCLEWISMSGTSTGNVLVANNIDTGRMQIQCSLTGNNTFYHNNFYNFDWNRTATTNLANTWSVNGQGNYWSNYMGTDKNGDGIGDTPYVIDSKNADNYPLMRPVNVQQENCLKLGRS
jgi:hypothetical protein